MKFLTLSTIALAFSLVASTTATDCPQRQVPNTMHLCIQPQYIEGCQTYEWIDSCHECQEGYHLNDKRCDYIGQFSEQILVGCLQTQNGACINCANGFKRESGRCIRGTKNCKAYGSDMKCTQCDPDFSLISQECHHNLLLGCKVENHDHTCSECWAPFTLNQNHCDIHACMSLNDFGCTTCQCGYYLTTERNCKQIQNGCMRYERNRCVDCLPHYKLKGGICEIEGCQKYENHSCLKCRENYNLVNGGCEFQNCFDWAHDECLVCNTGFKVRQGVCVQGENLVCE